MIEPPKRLIERIYEQDFGLLPTNFSIKPVHVANGLGRALTGRVYDTTALIHLLRRWVRNQRGGYDEERHPNQEIIETHRAAFASHSGPLPDEEKLSALRTLAHDVLGADGAVFDDPAKSSYTLSNERFITSDPSDHRTGLFLARLLTAGEAGDAAGTIKDLLSSEEDPLTSLALPMLHFAIPRDAVGTTAGKDAADNPLFALGSDGRLASPTLATLRDAFDRLARFEIRKGSKLNSLRRLVLFGCFAIHVHLTSRWSEVAPEAPRPPLFIDMFDGLRPPLRNASRASLRAAGDAVEGLLAARCRESVEDSIATGDRAETLIEHLGGPTSDELARRFQVYTTNCGLSADAALAEAFLELGLEQTKGHPVGFLTELGRRAGYLSPWANQGRGGKLQKRYSLTAEFLETLVAATVEPDGPVEFPDFCGALRAQFGILVGRHGDAAAIARNNLRAAPFGSPTTVSEEELGLNVGRLRQTLVEIGLAKAYADGQTIVSNDPESLGWM